MIYNKERLKKLAGLDEIKINPPPNSPAQFLNNNIEECEEKWDFTFNNEWEFLSNGIAIYNDYDEDFEDEGWGRDDGGILIEASFDESILRERYNDAPYIRIYHYEINGVIIYYTQYNN